MAYDNKYNQNTFDVVIVGASFAGLTLAHHLPTRLKILVIDAKPSAGSSVESTGLITEATRRQFLTFTDIDSRITNRISSICVVAPDFERHFVSTLDTPWIFQTDTRALISGLAAELHENVTLMTSTLYLGQERQGDVARVDLRGPAGNISVLARFLVGSDGAHSKVAQTVRGLDRNSRFLFGYENVIPGTVNLGPKPEETIYHFWFGQFSLGYGGWLSPTCLLGKPSFRIGLAKMMNDRGQAKELTARFTSTLQDRQIVSIRDGEKSHYTFGGIIPISGLLKRNFSGNCLLIGDAGGFCGAFAADGIKGAVVSAKTAAPLIDSYLRGRRNAPSGLVSEVQKQTGLAEYYGRQLRYRLIWDMMRHDRTFSAMYDIVASEKDSFLQQFCDSKDRHKSLTAVVIKIKHLPKLIKYAWYLTADVLGAIATRFSLSIPR